MNKLDKLFKKFIVEYDPVEYFSRYITPELEGYEKVKTAILLMLVSEDYMINFRHRLHLGLVGMAGTGKTVFMQYLERVFNAVYLTQDTSISTLKADARKKDYGVQIFKNNDKGIICIDEIELMRDRETLRDVMEKGEVIYSKAGNIEKYPARIRLVVGSNNFNNMSEALLDRLDFIFYFNMPSVEEAKKIARKIIELYTGNINYEKQLLLLREYIEWAKSFKPTIGEDDKENVINVFDKYFDYIGEGRTGRFITRILRIATAHAKLYHRNIIDEDIKYALYMIKDREEIISEMRKKHIDKDNKKKKNRKK